MNEKISSLLVSGLVIGSILTGKPTESSAQTTTESSFNAYAPAILRALNGYRFQNGDTPVVESSLLNSIETQEVEQMVEQNYVSHTSPDGQTFGTRMSNDRIKPGYWGEDIVVVPDSIDDVPGAVMTYIEESPEHDAIAKDPRYANVGIAISEDSKGDKIVSIGFTQKVEHQGSFANPTGYLQHGGRHR